MKPYTDKRLANCPDVSDCVQEGRPSRFGGGRSYARPKDKAAARRQQARSARRAARADIDAERG